MKSSKYPKLLVQKGKHSTDYFLLKSEKDRHQVSLSIVKDWLNSGYLYKYDNLAKNFADYCQKEAGITDKEFQELINDPKLAKVKISLGDNSPAVPKDNYDSLMKEYKEYEKHNKIYDKAKECIKKKDGKLAWEIIRYHQGQDYMSVEEQFFYNVNN